MIQGLISTGRGRSSRPPRSPADGLHQREEAIRITPRSSPGDWPAHLRHLIVRLAYQVYRDGFVLAGNFAYLALLAVLPFFVILATIAGAVGRSDYGRDAVSAFLSALPPSVTSAIRGPIEATAHAQSGPVLWLAVLVGLWTTASLIESIRDIIRRAYGTGPPGSFWQFRLASILLIIGAVVLTFVAFGAQVLVAGIGELVDRLLPPSADAFGLLLWSQAAATLTVFGTLWLLFRLLTPLVFVRRRLPLWPGPLVTSLWWLGATALMPRLFEHAVTYDLTYGSLAGVMFTLIFFFLIGLGMVIGAELNAVLARELAPELSGDGAEGPSTQRG